MFDQEVGEEAACTGFFLGLIHFGSLGYFLYMIKLLKSCQFCT